MIKARSLFELSYFVYLAALFINKYYYNPMLSKGLLIASGIALLYELIYIVFLHRGDLISFPRTLAISGMFISIDVLILLIVYTVSAFLSGITNIPLILSSSELFVFYDLPEIISIPFGNLVILLVCIIYISLFYVITNKIDHRITF